VRLSVPASSNNWYQSKVHLGVIAIIGVTLVVTDRVMALSGSSGGEVTEPCVGLCMVTSGSQRCGSGSCVGHVEHAVLDGVSHQKDGVCRK
jgi:hypothetical protein